MSSDRMSPFASTVMNERYAHTLPDGTKESWDQIANRVASNVLGSVLGTCNSNSWLMRDVANAIAQRKILPGGRYLYASGRDFHQVQNCLLLRAEDSREGWADLLSKATMALMTGAGIGVDYSSLREEGKALRRTGGYSSGPLALMQAVNEVGRAAKQGGNRRAAIWAGLRWDHPDVDKFIALKDWSQEVKAIKANDYNFPAMMDHTNISVILDDNFFDLYAKGDDKAKGVYWAVVRHACETGEPGFSIDVGANSGESLRNACTEVTSRDDSDICNLASINLANVSCHEMDQMVFLATALLVAGTVYSDVPYPKVATVRKLNRRLGLGLMGIHERIAKDGYKYGHSDGLKQYLASYEKSTDYARLWASNWGLSPPVKTRAIAPTGTIGIVAETTTGIEPIFCAAYKRRYYDHGVWRHQYVVDPTARRLFETGTPSCDIEDAYSISPEIRVSFQADIQRSVDHGISSTINMPQWGSDKNNEETIRPFGEMLLKYLPKLRGLTVYPDGARGGQPLTPCDFQEAMAQEGQVFTEQADICDIRGGGSCGS